MIRKLDQVFVLDTENTTYCFRVLETGQLEHLYYGNRIYIDSALEAESLFEKHAFAPGTTILYDRNHKEYSLENMRLEMSSRGTGDIRDPFVVITHNDGGRTSDFIYDHYEISDEKTPLETMPSSYSEDTDDVKELVVTMICKNYGTTLELHYAVFEKKDVITRYAKVLNTTGERIRIECLMSTQIDFETDDFIFTTFNGSWAREMDRHDTRVEIGRHINSSSTGLSSNKANPFVMLHNEETTEDAGDCYGFNLVYSGNHMEIVEADSYHKTRFLSGINHEGFAFSLNPEDSFEAPEAIMTYSDEGYGGMSRRMHHFVRECIVRGQWKKKVRPVLLNSWEAFYFDINEAKLLKLAKSAKDVGIELLVMDDGWFGSRNNDQSSLGDWEVNTKKIPSGLDGLCKKINDMGLDFGLWVEPEMVNEDSDFYRQHPYWTLQIPGKDHSEGRNQIILDLTNPEVVDAMIEKMTNVFSSANISYVKWDMNRIMSDFFAPYLAPKRQKETAHRYVLGLYRMLKTLTERFPHILFEGCASGGNRFDLGILSYFPQIWASDDTDAIYRVNGQTGYSYGYPSSVISAHVSSCPNHQTLRVTPLTTRFNVAAFGVCGYECNLIDMKREDLEEIKKQIEIYKEWRDVLQFGSFYRGRCDNIHEWTCVSEDKSRAIGMILQELTQPNNQFLQYKAKGLDRKKKYHFTNRTLVYDLRAFGDLVNTAAPIHIRQDSLMHRVIARFVNMPGEIEDYHASGATLMAGVKLHQAFVGTGFNDNTRYFPDFASRIYFMEEE